MIEARAEHDEHGSGMVLHEEPERSLVEVWGEVDLSVRQTAGPLCEAVVERALPVVIDARRVTFMDSAGMSILVRIARDAETTGYPVVLENAPWMLKELLTITGVDRLLPIAEDDEPGTPAAGETSAQP